MNTKEALVKSIVMWDWLALHPDAHKADAVDACFPHESRPLHNCFVCKSTMTDEEDAWAANCTKCPVWPATDDEHTFHGCEDNGSPYAAWLDYKDFKEMRSDAARAVADLCRVALKRL